MWNAKLNGHKSLHEFSHLKGHSKNKRTTHSKGTKGIMGLFHRKGTIGSKRTFYWKGTKGSLGLFHSKGTMGSLGSFHWKGSNVHFNCPIQFYNRLNKCDLIKQALINISCSTLMSLRNFKICLQKMSSWNKNIYNKIVWNRWEDGIDSFALYLV